MAWYPRIRAAIQQAVPFLLPTQATNLALVVSALLARRSKAPPEETHLVPSPFPLNPSKPRCSRP